MIGREISRQVLLEKNIWKGNSIDTHHFDCLDSGRPNAAVHFIIMS